MSEDATLNRFLEESHFDGENKDSELDPKVLTGVSDEWMKTPLAGVADNREDSFVDGPFGANLLSEEYHSEGFARIIKLQNIRSGKFINTNKKYITEEKLKELERHSAYPNEIAIAKMAKPVARACILPSLEERYILAAADVVKLDSGQNFSNIFVMYALNSHPVWKQAFSRARGTGRKRINLNQLKEVQIPTPPLSEQRKIATVLHTVDRAIEIANNISDQVERVEQGLQQILFTGEHLNCERKEAPTIGQVPVDWQIKTMGNVCNITMGSSPKSEHYNESGDGLPFFQANNEFGLRNPKHDRWCSKPVKTANRGDSLMTLRGTYVGQMNIADRECCIGRGLAGISAGEELLEEYLYQHLRRRERYVKSIAIGSTFDSVSSSELENLPIVIPPKEEQGEIAKTLKSVQERLKFTKEYTEQLHRLKHGLMQDLLLGTVRTTDTNIQVPEEIAQYG